MAARPSSFDFAQDGDGCPATDQRGYTRDATCDIGAYEYGASGSVGGPVLARAPYAPRVVGDAPSALARPLLSGPAANETWKVYYYAGAQLIAMRVLTGTTGNALYYLHGDHLGSTSLVTNASGAVLGRQSYTPYGSVRSGGGLPTDIGFTGQRAESGLGSLMHFNARMYSPYLNRWLQPDTIVPAPLNPQSLNRYSYVRNNPLRYTDPSGHCEVICLVIGVGIALIVWLAYPEPVYAPEPGWTPPTDVDPNYGDKAYFDTAPGTGDISDIYAMATGRTLFTGEEVDAGNRALVGAAAVLPVVTSGALKQTRKLFDIVRYGDDASGFIKHHGVLDIWAAANIPGYVRRNPDAPTILLTKAQHDTTIELFNKWRLDKTGSITGYIDWSKISPKEVQALAEQMFRVDPIVKTRKWGELRCGWPFSSPEK
jgi:RHS repeat-associated protein